MSWNYIANSVLALLQVLVTSRFQLIGVNQSTFSLTVARDTNAQIRPAPHETSLVSQGGANETKRQIHRTYEIPKVIGFINGTLIRILAPAEQEHEFVCRKGYHAINGQEPQLL